VAFIVEGAKLDLTHIGDIAQYVVLHKHEINHLGNFPWCLEK
jgi:hypothetical protein